MAGSAKADREELEITDVAELRAWLTEHQDTADGVWLVTWKRSADPVRHVPYDAVVRECLCVGWVDSQARAVDRQRTALLLTPRRPGSGWARTNKQRVAELMAAGLLQPRGLAVVEEAQRSGAWTSLDDIEDLVEPEDLRAALDAEPEARRGWDGFPRSARRAALVWLASAKRPETRAKRIAETADKASRGVRVGS